MIGRSDGLDEKVPLSVRRKEDLECTREEYIDKWMVFGRGWEPKYPIGKGRKNIRIHSLYNEVNQKKHGMNKKTNWEGIRQDVPAWSQDQRNTSMQTERKHRG